MSDETKPEVPPAAAPATEPTPPAQPPAPPAPTPEPPKAAPDAEPPWLNDRLKRAGESAQKALLDSLGVTDPEQAKAAIAAAKAAEEANKTAEQKAAEANETLKSMAERVKAFEAVTKSQADQMMSVLTEEQQAAVKAIAGDDAAQQLNAISVLGKTWAKQAQQEAAPANTAPAPTAPAPTTPGSPPDPQANYSQLAKANPFRAAAYGLRHMQEVYKPTE